MTSPTIDIEALKAVVERAMGRGWIYAEEETLKLILSLIARTEAAEGENEQLRLAICGGEDVPGLAASLPLHTVLGIQNDNVATSRSALERLWTEQARTAELVAQRDGLVEALEQIRDLEPKPFEYPADWQQQIAACPECEQYRDHPIQQGICNTHRQPIWGRDRHADNEERRIGWAAKSIARVALSTIKAGGGE